MKYLVRYPYAEGPTTGLDCKVDDVTQSAADCALNNGFATPIPGKLEYKSLDGGCKITGDEVIAGEEVAVPENIRTNYAYSRSDYATSFKRNFVANADLYTDLTGVPVGSGKVYLKIAEDYPNPFPLPIDASENKYGLLGELTNLGTEVATSPRIMAAQNYSLRFNPSLNSSGGWYVKEATVIVKPDFEHNIENCEKCKTCKTGNCEPGTGDLAVNSIGGANKADLSISLGQTAQGQNSAGLNVTFTGSNSMNYNPSRIEVFGGGTSSIINDSKGAARQVKAEQVTADIVTTDASNYEIRIYPASQVSSTKNSSGLYTFSGSPSHTWKVQNPNGTNDFSTVNIIDSTGSLSKTNQVSWTTQNGIQSLNFSQGNGLYQESRSSTIDPTTTNRVETITVKNSAGTVASKVANTYHQYSFGEALVQQVLDPDGAAKTTQRSYNDVFLAYGYRQLQQVIRPDGSWERYEYDRSGRIIKDVTPYLDAPVGSADNLCRVVTTTYLLTDPAVTVVESVLGVEVSRKYTIIHATEQRQITAHAAGASWDDPLNEVTITKFLLGGPFEGRVQSILRPDGTLTFYDYSQSGSQITTTVKTGQPNADNSDVVNGTKTVTLQDLNGNTLSEMTYDISSGLQLSSAIATQKDAFGRPTRIEYNDGTYTTTSYGCCGLDTTRDRQGITTSYIYDALKRPTTVSRAGIVTTTTYDASGNVLKVVEKGTDGTSITTTTSTYDLAGRLKTSKDALGKTTSYSEGIDANGHFFRTTTLPNSKTEIRTFYKDGQLLSLAGSAVHPLSYEYGVEADGVFTKEYRVNTGGVKTEWTKTYTDFMGRQWKKLNADNSFSTTFYYQQGQPVVPNGTPAPSRMTVQTDEDGVVTILAYNSLGELQYQAIDTNRNGTIDFSGTDVITRTIRDVITNHGTTVQRTSVAKYYKNGSSTATTVQTDEVSANGLQSWSTSYGLTTSRQTTYDGNGGRTEVTTAPDGTVTTVKFQNDLPTSSVTQNAGTGVLSSLSYGYDGHRRQNSITDLRTGTTSIVYDSAGRRTSVTTPAPDNTASPQTTSFKYDSVGSVTNITLPDGGTVKYSYASTGELLSQSGTRTYSTTMTYDGIGRLSTLKAGTGTTTWKYKPDRGFLSSKVYADGKGPSYTYTVAGRLKSRSWARANGLTTYSYDNNGMLQTIDYADSTPDVAYTYDRVGRTTKIAGTTETVDMSYNTAGEMLSEKNTGGPLSGVVTTNTFDSLLRRTKIQLTASGLVSSYGYQYDTASRLSTVTAGTNSIVYGYAPNSSLVQTLTFKNGPSTRMTTTKDYDNLNRLKSISSVPSADSVRSFSYQYNDANQRWKVTLADGSYWIYQYDSLGQVTSGKKYFSDSSLVPGQSFDYTFDNIGNRLTETDNSNPSRASIYTPNNLNQYTQRTVPGVADVMGTAKPDSTVTVNNQPTTRHGDYFHKELSADNTAGPVLQPVDIVGVKNNLGGGGEDAVTETKGNLYLPKTPEIYQYDFDGNLTQDGRWNYTWDAENRLVSMQSIASVPDTAKRKLDFLYDYQGRRIQKTVSIWNPSTSVYGSATSTKSIYDGWNCIAILNSNFSILNSFVWGIDLSGSMTGAGGVDGLLISSTFLPQTSNFVAMDGNGNVTDLVDASTGKISAEYEYNPFGEVLRATGPMAKINPFRFSTKYQDEETRLVHYGYRYYNESTGRWLSREPLEEVASKNLYAFLNNHPTTSIDYLGLYDFNDFLDDAYKVRDKIPQPFDKDVHDNASAQNRKLFDDFKNGTGDDFRWFGPESGLVQELKNHSAIKKAREEIKKELQSRCSLFNDSRFEHPIQHNYKGIGGKFNGAIEILDLAINKNSTAVILGSFTGKAYVGNIRCCDKKADIRFSLYNPMSLESWTRNPVTLSPGGTNPISGPYRTIHMFMGWDEFDFKF